MAAGDVYTRIKDGTPHTGGYDPALKIPVDKDGLAQGQTELLGNLVPQIIKLEIFNWNMWQNRYAYINWPGSAGTFGAILGVTIFNDAGQGFSANAVVDDWAATQQADDIKYIVASGSFPVVCRYMGDGDRRLMLKNMFGYYGTSSLQAWAEPTQTPGGCSGYTDTRILVNFRATDRIRARIFAIQQTV
jgi:hypothetical protein